MEYKLKALNTQNRISYVKHVMFRQLSDIYMHHYPLSLTSFFIRPAVDNLVKNSIVIMIMDEEYPELILGFTIVEKPNIVHFLYIKETYRKHGLAKDVIEKLFAGAPIITTLVSPTGKRLLEKFNATVDNRALKHFTLENE